MKWCYLIKKEREVTIYMLLKWLNMNDIISILKNYFNEKAIDIVKKDLSKKQRTWIMNDNYFAKVGKNSNILFFNNLVNEIKLYKNNQGNVLLPKLVESFVSDEYCLIILEKDNGKTLSNQRNEYNIGLSDSQRIEIAKSVLNIKNIKINCEINNNYSRKVSLDKYLERSKNISRKSHI